MGSSPISGKFCSFSLFRPARVFEPHIGNSGTSTHLLFFLCASFCQTASPRSGASDFARPRSSVASSSPPPRAACISGTLAVFACTVLPMCLLGEVLPASPCISPYLPVSPCISLHLPRREEAAGCSRSPCKYLHVSPCIYLYLPASPLQFRGEKKRLLSTLENRLQASATRSKKGGRGN